MHVRRGVLAWAAVLAGGAGCFGSADLRLLAPELPRAGAESEERADVACGARGPVLHRLNGSQYDNTVSELLGQSLRPSRQFPADGRLEGFDDDQDHLAVSPLLVESYEAAAKALATAAWAGGGLRACDPAQTGEEPCLRRILEGIARRAWRRPATAEELSGLVSVLSLARANGDGFEAAVQLGIRAVLLSPNSSSGSTFGRFGTGRVDAPGQVVRRRVDGQQLERAVARVRGIDSPPLQRCARHRRADGRQTERPCGRPAR